MLNLSLSFNRIFRERLVFLVFENSSLDIESFEITSFSLILNPFWDDRTVRERFFLYSIYYFVCERIDLLKFESLIEEILSLLILNIWSTLVTTRKKSPPQVFEILHVHLRTDVWPWKFNELLSMPHSMCLQLYN